MRYGLTQKQLQEIQAILTGQPKVESVWLFGSRALDTYKEASDIDLAIKGSLGSKTLVQLKDKFEDSNLPFFVDLVDYERIKEPALKKHIDTYGICIYGWQEVKLGEIAEITSSKRIFYSDYVSEGIPFWRSKEVIEKFNRKEISTDLFITPEKYSEIKNKFGVPQPNDILLTSVGTLGIPYLVEDNEPFYFKDGNLTWIRNIDELRISPYYMYKWLASQPGRYSLQEITIGSTQEALTIIGLKSLNLLLPPLPEQKAIAAVLSSLDDKIDLLHRQNKTLEAMAATLFRQWFVEEAHEDWENGVISDLVEFNPPRKLAKGTIAPYLEMASLRTSTFNPAGWYDREFSSGTKFMNGDTLLARITPCLENGKTAYVTILDKDQVGWGSTEYIVMRPKGELHPFFAYALARYSDFRDFAEGCLAGSSGRQRVETNHLMSYRVKIPAVDIVRKFNTVAESIAPKLHSNAIQIRTLETFRDTLLPKLMSGAVRVTLDS